jgi:hypothetical protein
LFVGKGWFGVKKIKKKAMKKTPSVGKREIRKE